jgi:sterol desaturase/sphingolipid hydroxylase (fatty acid hydroxylase superfamily)
MSSALIMFTAFAVMAGITALENRRNPGPTDWARNLQAYGLDFGVAYFVHVYWPQWLGGSLIDASHMPFAVGLVLFFFARDFTEWLFHYAQHRLPWLWAMHSLHHSDPEMTALTTNRHFWGDRLVKALTIWPLSTMLINPTNTMFVIYATVSLYNYFIHANLKVNFGRWSWLLNSPAYHRRHHSRLAEHYDTNFAALFPIFDVIAGTYRRPDGWPPCGLDDQPRSFADLIDWPFKSRLRPWLRRITGKGQDTSGTLTSEA